MTAFFASCPKGLENLLAHELTQLGATDTKTIFAGVHFECEQKDIYRICLWSRLANQIFMPLQRTKVNNWDEIYRTARQFDWQEHMLASHTFALDVDIINNKTLTNSLYATQKLKDGLVDYWRDKTQSRPSVKIIQPDVRFHALIQRDQLTLSINLSGDSLHRRGYRQDKGTAPLKENLAAAILLKTNWPRIAHTNGSLLDPLCGSATLLIEGALMAADIAPGLLREHFGFLAWQQFQPKVWKDLIQEAQQRREAGLANLPSIIGYDGNAEVIRKAQLNIKRAGLSDYIQLAVKELGEVATLDVAPGLIVTNPPYGIRLGEQDALNYTYRFLGQLIKKDFQGWNFALFTGNPELAKKVGMAPSKQDAFFNGTIACQLLQYEVRQSATASSTTDKPIKPEVPILTNTNEGIDFVNRLKKNIDRLSKWAVSHHISCYRLYDADLPDYALAIDRYDDKIHVQEYAPPKSIDPQKAAHRLQVALYHISAICGVDHKSLFLKTRQKQKGLQQYQKFSNDKNFYKVTEGPAQLLVNLSDYLDTGLFLDSRRVRQWIYDHCTGKTFLNLFCYTGSASVYAALGKAKKVVSIDLSATYIQWAKRNFALNGLATDQYTFIQEDCLAWLKENRDLFDLILLDPPTFSNSKRMTDTLDIQRDHAMLIELAAKHLKPNGTLIFVTNKKNFKIDKEALAHFNIKDITANTLPEDFKKSSPHQAFLITG